MSTSSNGSLGRHRRLESLPKQRIPSSRTVSQKHIVTSYDAYTYALRAAYLCHLLQPKAKRLQHAPPQRPTPQRQTTSVADLVKDFSLVRDSKSTRFPKDFLPALDKRLNGVVNGIERLPEFKDASVKRSFALFLTEFKKPEFRKGVEKDRRVEDLILIFFSNATKELSKTKKSPEDDSWKFMVDRHVALFVRLVSSTLKANEGSKNYPELANRLQVLENKLLLGDQNLASATKGDGSTTIEVEVPRSQHVKDMPLVLTVAKIFHKDASQAQADINDQKDLWTEKSALRDLKLYQTNLSLNSTGRLRSEDFDTDAGYEAWRKAETMDLSQMILAIIQSNIELAKETPGILPQFKPSNGRRSTEEPNAARPFSDAESGSSYVIDQPVDISGLSLNGQGAQSPVDSRGFDTEPYMFIPPEPRTYFRLVLKEAVISDMTYEDPNTPGDVSPIDAPVRLLSKKSMELLNEIGVRWRVPQMSRLMLFMDVVRELFINRTLDLDALDAAFNFIKEPQLDKKKIDASQLFDRSRWTVADFVLNQQILASLHETLLRDLFEELEQSYNVKPPSIGPIMTILESHIYEDPNFTGTTDELDRFGDQLQISLQERAREIYRGMYDKEVEKLGDRAEFYHVIQLGKSVLKLIERIQKRYRKTPHIMGVDLTTILVKVVLPSFAADAENTISSILKQAETRNEEISVEDGFELYKEMVEMRRIHTDAFPGVVFGMRFESLLAPFVWRWITSTEEKVIGWVENAVRQDLFQVRTEEPGQVPTEDERHSVSVIDIFRSFNEAIEQVVKLDWADDLQHAKFMTALAKTVGTGIDRYCEQVEQFFVKEMDRLTPDQELALTQTKHEKWMRMAKDAIMTKEKMEPFQFLPESFVKLNNVEWAMQQLDRLEKEVDVDACAEIISKREPPTAQAVRGSEKFVFTIKIIEAEDLKACDMNGLSDPYVVLGDEYQKRLAKTRIIYGNLNPRWDETIDITTKGPLNVIATIWDWDVMGDHDCVGRTSIKLDPSHFRDFLPREYWLDLDTQGRLLVRVSMEGEKDDIRFYFGKAFRTLKRTERDMTRKITDKLSAYIQYCLSRRTLKSLTSKGLSISTVSSYFQRNRPQPVAQPVPVSEIENALKPLFTYFDENFAIMNQTLTRNSMIMVMTRLWKETLSTIESLLVPPLSDKLSAQRQLSEQEMDIVFKWLQLLFDFFHAVNEETGMAQGVPLDVLKSPKYHDLQNLNFFYYESTENLIRISERMAAVTADRQKEAQARSGTRLSAPGAMSSSLAFGGAEGFVGLPSTRRSKSVMVNRNLGTMKKAKEEKRKEAQAEPSDDMILRILRMRPEAERYLRDRSRQKQRLAATAAAEMIVKQSLAASSAKDREIRKMQRFQQG